MITSRPPLIAFLVRVAPVRLFALTQWPRISRLNALEYNYFSLRG